MNILAALVLGSPTGGVEPEPVVETLRPNADDPNGAQTLEVSELTNYWTLWSDDSDSTFAYEEVFDECPTYNDGEARVQMEDPSETPLPTQTVKTQVKCYPVTWSGSFGGGPNLFVRIYQGTDLKFTHFENPTPETAAWYTWTWSQANIESITDWSDVRVDVEVSGCVTAEGDDAEIRVLEVQIVLEE